MIYTHPEIAWVGATEEELKAQEIPYTVGLFPFAASGRAKAVDATDGFIKILASRDSDQILGAHMIGSQVSELINEAVLAMSMEASAEDLARTVRMPIRHSQKQFMKQRWRPTGVPFIK